MAVEKVKVRKCPADVYYLLYCVLQANLLKIHKYLLTFVLTQYRMDQYLELEYRHYKTNDGSKSSSTENLRSYYFSNITCAQFEKLKIVYQMDLDIFDYSDEPFRSFCV